MKVKKRKGNAERIRRLGCASYRVKAVRSDLQDRPCPDCGEASRAYATMLVREGRIQRRVCRRGHQWIWLADRPKAIRPSKPREIAHLVCIFPGCGLPTTRMIRKARGKGDGGSSSLCQGHEKQKQRYGWAALRSFKPRNWRGGPR